MNQCGHRIAEAPFIKTASRRLIMPSSLPLPVYFAKDDPHFSDVEIALTTLSKAGLFAGKLSR